MAEYDGRCARGHFDSCGNCNNRWIFALLRKYCGSVIKLGVLCRRTVTLQSALSATG